MYLRGALRADDQGRRVRDAVRPRPADPGADGAYPLSAGLSEHDPNRPGRAELLATPFEDYGHHVRDEMGRALGAGGFDPDRDITGITVNRRPYGYAPGYNPLWEELLPEANQPQVVGRKRFGRIAIANSDSGVGAYTNVAIDQAHRAVNDLQS